MAHDPAARLRHELIAKSSHSPTMIADAGFRQR
jgi:hypothetical protein